MIEKVPDYNSDTFVLIVDDEEGIRNALQSSLSRDDYKIELADSGEQALEFLSDGHIDLVISDYKLPGINGIETIAQAKQNHPDLASILITGYGSDETIIDAFTHGRVDFYLSKPFEMRELRKITSLAIKDRRVRLRERAFQAELQREVDEATSELKEKNRLLEVKESETARLNKKLQDEKKRLDIVNERLEELSITDGLTGLFNYRYFAGRLNEEFSRAKRYSGKLSLLMLDIDDFKKVNDQYGHLAGDEVLRRVGKALSTSSRQIDMAARYGGEEFALLLPEVGLDGASLRAERLRVAIEDLAIDYGMLKIPVTVSIGAASYVSEKMKTPNDLIRAADKALYHSKMLGKNCVVIIKNGRFHPVGKEYILTEKQRKNILKDIEAFAGSARSLDDILEYLIKKLGGSLGVDSKTFYISIMMKNSAGGIEEFASLNKYNGRQDLKKIAKQAIYAGSMVTNDQASDPVSCFPIKFAASSDGKPGMDGAIILNLVPSYPDFIEALFNDLSAIIMNADALEKMENQKNMEIVKRLELKSSRHNLLSGLLKDIIRESFEGGLEETLSLHGENVIEILRAEAVSVYTYNTMDNDFVLLFDSGSRQGKGGKRFATDIDAVATRQAATRFLEKGDGALFSFDETKGGSGKEKPAFKSICAPITAGDQLLGAIIATRKKIPMEFDRDDMELAGALSDILSVSMLRLGDNDAEQMGATRKKALS